MLTLTASSVRCWEQCPRKYHYRYELLRRPRRDDEAEPLRVGSDWHGWLDRLWQGEAALHLLSSIEPGPMRALLAHYIAQRHQLIADSGWRPEVVIGPVRLPGCRGVRLAGKADLLGDDVGGEHKTTSDDISPGSVYWQRLRGDGQLLMYSTITGIRRWWYDVARKPRHKTEEAAAEAIERSEAEGKPYVAAAEVCFTDVQVSEFQRSLRDVVRLIRTASRPCSASSCWDYYRACDYWPVCHEGAHIDDGDRYVVAETQHTELEEVQP